MSTHRATETGLGPLDSIASVARMVPFPMLPTESSAERRLYEGFLEQLGAEFVVYHSVDWVLSGKRGPVEGEADFIIAHPLHGLLVLEAKGGRVLYNPSTRRWTQSGRSGTHVIDEDPFHQARDEMHSLIEILSAQEGWSRWMPSYGYGVAMPDGTYDTDALPAAPHQVVIDRADMARLADRIVEVMRYWRRPGRTFGAEGLDRLARALGFAVEIRTPLMLDFDEDDRKIVELTDDQAWILAFVAHRRRAVVTGPAGSGKTLLAIQIARRLADAGHPTLLTCFSERLADYLRSSTEGVDRLEVHHFYDLCVQVATEAGLALPTTSPDPTSPSFERELPALLSEGASKLGPRYDAIVVDEAQNFREWWWPALLMLHRDPEDGMLYLFADDNQKLHGASLPVSGGDARAPQLTTNLRNTTAIHEFVSVFYDGQSRPTAQGPPGRPPEILGYQDDSELAHLLAVVLRNLAEGEHVPLDEIVVLTPSDRDTSRLLGRERVNGFALSDRVEDGKVLTASVDAFEGLERPVVILAELGDEHLEDIDRYLYVGGSRARSHLIVLAAEPVARRLRRLTGVTRP
jgi:hypothetical protein